MIRSYRALRQKSLIRSTGRRTIAFEPKQTIEVSETISLPDLDKKWAKIWASTPFKDDKISANGEKKYILSMFPYPSGMLHMGHLRVYTISDVLSRFHRAKGSHVIHPMGWDAFGLPAENAAIERNINPSEWTKDNISKMKEQMKMMLVNFDWDREVTTCNPDYYKWTQKIFLMLFKEGLAYRKEAEINWDPVDQTVLANEQVDSEGKSWRSGALVEKKLLNQWFLGITNFAHDLNKDLEILDQWPSKVKKMQENWIGESKGVEISFQANKYQDTLTVFTTRPDTIFSIQYLALSIDHPITKEIANSNEELRNFISQTRPDDSKDGFELADFKVSHPFKSKTFEIPVFVAPYVLGSYGSGVVMGCPAHDERDFEFWNLNKPDVPVRKSVFPKNVRNEDSIFTSHGFLKVDDKEFDGLSSLEAQSKVIAKLSSLDSGKEHTQYRIRDWLISRQRYWGAPIPIIHCDDCGPVAVPDEQLPVVLPEDAKIVGKGNPLANLKSFIDVDCPSCGKPSKRDTDTMDTFMDSSWYYLRYTDPQNKSEIFNSEIATKSMPVDIYIGGVEHAILHLLYSRFISKFLSKYGYWDGSSVRGEPFKKLVTQGMVHGKTYIDSQNGRFLKPEELDLTDINRPKILKTGETPSISYEKMSKSKYNGADPGSCIKKHGADATRAHILFQAPITDILDWDESKIVGIERWLRRLIQLASSDFSKTSDLPLKYNESEIKFHNETESLLKSITDSFEISLSLNTVISDYMKYTRAISAALENDEIDKSLILRSYKNFLISTSPVIPATAEEAWERLHISLGIKSESIFSEPWPELQPLKETDSVKYNVFINGKMRLTHVATKDFYQNEAQVKDTIISLSEAQKYLEGKTIKKIITKPKTISFVVV